MVGIVIVSHSEKLAAGVQELALGMGQGTVQMAIAAGIDDPENPFGTDAIQVYQAITSVYSDEGVVVFMDLGSAIMSAEMALEFLPEAQRTKVKLCSAPLVEGTIAAVVQAAAGANIEQVIQEAQGALAAKVRQISGEIIAENQETLLTGNQVDNKQIAIQLIIQNSRGLHARPAAKFVATALQFPADINVQNISANSPLVNGKSINQLVTLGVRQGDEIAIAASGKDAEAALAALQELVDDNFGEKHSQTLKIFPPVSQSPIPNSQSPIFGIPASPGIAIGRAYLHQPFVAEVIQEQTDNPQREWQQLQTAIATVRQEIENLRQQATLHTEEAVAGIFDAHLLYLADPVLLETTRNRIFTEDKTAASAWKSVIDETIASYQSLSDSYLQMRGLDVADVGQQVLRLLTGTQSQMIDFEQPIILVTRDLKPSEVIKLDITKVLGVCTVIGGATSHGGIIAKSLGIPVVMGLGAEFLRWENEPIIALNGDTGEVWIAPDDCQLKELEQTRNIQIAKFQELKAIGQKPAVTQDGRKIKILANICSVADAKAAANAGAEGIGVLRSELLYLDRLTPPSEEEQVGIYQEIAATIFPHFLTIRLLDIGGDKPVSYLNMEQENNPFLGCRGIRLLLERPDLMLAQIKAILRSSHRFSIKLLLPMIASIREIRATKELINLAQKELEQAGIPFKDKIEMGIMIEVPAAAIMADQLAAEVDFFSIGTNDLSQYVMASDRTNSKVQELADAFAPAVLRMIQQTVKAGHKAGRSTAVCGELAASPLATPILLGLGVDELSMNPSAIPTIKDAISKLNMKDAEAIANNVLYLDSGADVRKYVVQNTR